MRRQNLKVKFSTLVLTLTSTLTFFLISCAPPVHHAHIDTTYRGKLVWPPPPEKPRIEYLWSFYKFLPEGKTLADYVAGEQGGLDDPATLPYLMRPFSLFVRDGKMYIVDQGPPRITVLDMNSMDVTHFGLSGEGKLVFPVGIVVGADGTVYVSDAETGRVNRYDRTGIFLGYLSKKRAFRRPTGLGIDSEGNIYVADTSAHRIRIYSPEGKLIRKFGKRGSRDGELNFPTHLWVDGEKIYVTDAMNFRIQIFSRDGKYLGKFGQPGDTYADLERPKGVAVDSFGHIYVVDTLQARVKIFDEKGRILLFFGEEGRSPGKFIMPAGIFIDEHNTIYIADTYNMRIQAFRLIEGR